MLLNTILILILIVSLVTDLKSRRILNIITFPTMAIGLTYHSIAAGWSGFTFSGLGLLLGFGLLLIPYLLDGMGAGDVKLLAAIGALKGAAFVFGAFLFTAITGGLIALIILFAKKDLLNTLKRIIIFTKIKTLSGLDRSEYHHAFPYGVAIVIGTAAQLGASLP
ncbi:prepilin peptidase [Bacillus sp. DNRA2]|uniref:A24 family peptidase n=1 Tax=Bacillus sp. DNRA2 TaxID=2723053 RepID=UPI00145DFD0C|nr:prepilin peptidase [Bacillus sp. DNRA2]NMD70117.1 prepilin peptidase [Bacillus sp. DNRA2]